METLYNNDFVAGSVLKCLSCPIFCPVKKLKFEVSGKYSGECDVLVGFCFQSNLTLPTCMPSGKLLEIHEHTCLYVWLSILVVTGY